MLIPATYHDMHLSMLIPATYHDMHLSMLIMVCLIIPVPTSIDCLAPGALQNWSTQMILPVVLLCPQMLFA